MPIKNNCNCIHGSIGTENEAIQGSIGKRTVRGKVEDTGFATVIKDHSKLDNLDYEHSGHTGFASSQDLEKKENKINFITLGETQGILDKKTLTKLISNLNNKIVYNLGIYHLIARNGEN